MAKIFQLELFIKEMSIWQLPHNSEQHDETVVEVTVYDNKDVAINGYVFGKNSTMNRGQNFLFTLDAMPIDEDKVFFKVFKKAYNRDKNFLGSGNIPIDKIFGDFFSQVFKDALAAQALRNQTQSGNASQVNQNQATGSTAQTSAGNTNASQTKVSGKGQQNVTPNQGGSATAKSNSKTGNQNAAKNNKNATQSQGAANTNQNQGATNQKATQNQGATNQNATQSQGAANQNQNQGATNQNTTQSQSAANTVPIQNLKTINVPGFTHQINIH